MTLAIEHRNVTTSILARVSFKFDALTLAMMSGKTRQGQRSTWNKKAAKRKQGGIPRVIVL